MPPMLRRLFLVFLPSLVTSVSHANDASWNCEQNKDSKEWVCVGEKKKVATAEPTPSPAKAEPVKAPATGTVTIDDLYPAKAAETEPVKSANIEPAPIAKPISPAPTVVHQSEPIEAKPASSTTSASIQERTVTPTKPSVTKTTAALPLQSASASNNTQRSGWNCGSSSKKATWDCQPIGAPADSPAPDQTVNPIVVGAESMHNNKPETFEKPMMSLLDPAFNHQQEQIFSTLTSQLPYDPWENCGAGPTKKRNFISSADLREVTPLDVKSNFAEIFDNEISDYSGNVLINRADQHAISHIANYDNVSDVMNLQGDVYYREDTLALHTEAATINLANDQAKLRDVEFISPTTPLRGFAESYFRKSKTLSQYTNVSYTTCRPGNQDWVIHASELEIDKVTGQGTTKNTWIEFKGTPVIYTPYLSFPIDDRRLSGFLSPTFSSTRFSGMLIAAPYYWNIAPNYDATLTPRELTSRGPLMAGKFRYLTEYATGKLGAEYMPNDSQLNTSRYLFSLQNSSVINPALSSNMDLNLVSDDTYIATTGTALGFTNYNYLRSFANVNYNKYGFNFIGAADSYQSINPAAPDNSLPYRRLPQLNLNYAHDFSGLPIHTEVQNELVNFQHTSNIIEGQRINTRPSISLPLQTASAFITPKFSLQNTNYSLNNGQDNSPAAITRTLPIFSADSGLSLERNVNLANSTFVHTIEPRLFYLYVPSANQNNIPVFDSSLYDFQFNTMFRENSFSGTDRIQNANQITTAFTSRLVDDSTGLERLKLNVGEIFYFQDRQIGVPTLLSNGTLVNMGASKDSESNLVTELSSELSRQISVNTGAQWNPIRNDIERIKANIHFKNQNNELFNIGYLYRKNPLFPDGTNNITQGDTSFRWPIAKDWHLLGRMQYSLLYNEIQDSFIGVEKENCCWRFRLLARHYMNNVTIINNQVVAATTGTTVPGSSQDGVFFQIELKGLTGFGDDVDQFLQRSIYGFRKTQKNDL
ncbi:MAG: LPS assembly protein LptD [Methylococcaceae bacterium]